MLFECVDGEGLHVRTFSGRRVIYLCEFVERGEGDWRARDSAYRTIAPGGRNGFVSSRMQCRLAFIDLSFEEQRLRTFRNTFLEIFDNYIC